MKHYVINPRGEAQYLTNLITVGRPYEILGQISGYDNVIFEDANASHCCYEESIVVVYDAHTLTNRQAWWVKHLIDIDCVSVVLVGDTSSMRSILNEGSIVVDENRNLGLPSLLNLGERR